MLSTVTLKIDWKATVSFRTCKSDPPCHYSLGTTTAEFLQSGLCEGCPHAASQPEFIFMLYKSIDKMIDMALWKKAKSKPIVFRGVSFISSSIKTPRTGLPQSGLSAQALFLVIILIILIS